jgi:hypothetical protein
MAGGRVKLESRNEKDFNIKYLATVQTLPATLDGAAIDGEVVFLGYGLAHDVPAYQQWPSSSKWHLLGRSADRMEEGLFGPPRHGNSLVQVTLAATSNCPWPTKTSEA